MKKYIFAVTALLILITFPSFSGDKSKLLIGKWKITDIDLGKPIPEGSKDLVKTMFDEMKKTGYLDFREDGSFETSMSDELEKGTWTLNKEGTLLMLKETGKEKIDSIMIDGLSAHKMMLVYRDVDSKFTLTLGK